MGRDTERLIAILPCHDVNKTRAFYERLGFAVRAGDEQYLMLSNGSAELHLQPAAPGWLETGKNPFGLYFYAKNVDELAARFPGELLAGRKAPEDKPWGMYEFALSDPDDTLVRIGRPITQPG